MRIFSLLVAVVVSLAVVGGVYGQSPATMPVGVGKPSIGINLNGPADWNTELPFVDVFRLSRRWISQKQGEGWGKGPALELDDKGWVKKLEPGCFAESPLMTVPTGRRPAGVYTVLYKGKGKLGFNGGKVVKDEPGRMEVDLGAGGGVFLRLLETDPTDPIRDIRVVMPGHEKTFESEPFRPGFLDRWRGVSTLRFMDWQHTNGSKQATWADRPTLDDATWTGDGGIPVEVMIDLSNRLKTDPWFCMPHLADDEYVREFATLVKAKLDPGLKVYVELSNEIWNGQFEQARHAGREGQRLKFAEKPWEAGWKWTGYRSAQVFKIWEEVFGGKERLVRVIASQSANSYVSDRILEFQDAYKVTDALAIAPYISFNISERSERNPARTAPEVAKLTVEQVLDVVEKEALPECVGWMAAQKRSADRFGVRLIAYEAGQHLVGVMGGENNAELTKLLHAANAHPRMGEIYRQYFTAWEQAGGGTMAMFASTGEWSKWGSWGLMQWYDQKPAEVAKAQATIDQAIKWGQTMSKE